MSQPVDAARLAEIDRLFEAVLDRPPNERDAFLDAACGPDDELRREVADLLLADGGDAALIDEPGGALSGAFGSVLLEALEPSEPLPDRIGAYLPLRLLGRGPRVAVFLAERAHGPATRPVALKLVRDGGGHRSGPRFHATLRTLVDLELATIARVHDAGLTDRGELFVASEHVVGQPVDQHADGHGLAVERRLRLVLELARALGHAHAKGEGHGSLHPGNVHMTHRGLRLLDMGVASLQAALLPSHGSPLRPPPSPETDVVRLGRLLYLLLTGRRAVDRRRPDGGWWPSRVVLLDPAERPGQAVEVARLRGAATPQHLARQLRGPLDAVVRTALGDDPAGGYVSVDALCADLEGCLRQGSLLHSAELHRQIRRIWGRLRDR